MADLEPSGSLAAEASKPYPSDSAEYRAPAPPSSPRRSSFNAISAGAQRRALPPGGEIARESG